MKQKSVTTTVYRSAASARMISTTARKCRQLLLAAKKRSKLPSYAFDKAESTHLIKDVAAIIINKQEQICYTLGSGKYIPLQALCANPNSTVTYDGNIYHHFCMMQVDGFLKLIGRTVLVEEVGVTLSNKWYQLLVIKPKKIN